MYIYERQRAMIMYAAGELGGIGLKKEEITFDAIKRKA